MGQSLWNFHNMGLIHQTPKKKIVKNPHAQSPGGQTIWLCFAQNLPEMSRRHHHHSGSVNSTACQARQWGENGISSCQGYNGGKRAKHLELASLRSPRDVMDAASTPLSRWRLTRCQALADISGGYLEARDTAQMRKVFECCKSSTIDLT